MFGLFKKFSAVRQGAEDALEIFNASTFDGFVAACAYVGGIDGDWDADEVAETKTAVQNHPALTPFKGEVATKIAEYEPLATKHGGRVALLERVEKVDPKFAKSVWFSAVDVADATGGIDAKEKGALVKLAEKMNLTSDKDVSEFIDSLK